MTKYWSRSNKGFYDSIVNSGSLPLDSTPITDALWNQLIHDQSNGKRIKDDGTGQPESIDVDLSNQEKIDIANSVILSILQSTAWTQAGDETNINQLAWATYRQEVRDVILQPGYPDNIVWPVAP